MIPLRGAIINFQHFACEILGERPYNCSMCFKSFGRRSALRIHKISVHQNIKSYLCPGKNYICICQYMYKQNN